jgi:type IV pilus assembly protein PilY1
VNWLGYLHSLWVDPLGHLREDTDGNGALTYGEDKIISFVYDVGSGDTMIQRYSDSDGDGEPDSATPDATVPLNEIDPIWEAGKKLALRDPDTRIIKTFVDADQDGVVDAGELVDFTEANAATLRPFLRAVDNTEAAKIIRFIRGEEVTGYRDRTVTVEGQPKVWPLGDIVYSTPTVVGKPMDDYATIYGDVEYYDQFFIKWRTRAATVYCGANDGMLHALKAGTFHLGDKGDGGSVEHGWYSATEVPATSGELGSERWAYIPYNVLRCSHIHRRGRQRNRCKPSWRLGNTANWRDAVWGQGYLGN